MSFIDDLFGTGGTTGTSSTAPWSVQSPYLKYGFEQAADIYKNAQGSPWFQGDLYAHLTPEQQALIGKTVGYSNGPGAANAAAVSNAGLNQMGQGANFGHNANVILGAAGGDTTGAILANAGRFADNPYLNSQIDAMAGDIRRNLGENILPEINNAASASGNTNSSRAGIAEGIARRGAAEAVADNAANMRANAYGMGVNTAQQQWNQDISNKLNANSQVGGALTTGAGLTGQGSDMSTSNFNTGLQAAGMTQADQQGGMDAAFQKWLGGDTRANELLQRYLQGVAGNNWGGTTKSQQGGGGGLLNTIVGAGTMLGGFL